MEITGRCLCGTVRYRVSAKPLASRSCWCRVCQYIGAGSATVNVCFPSKAIFIDGELRDFRSVADSGTVMHRRFCPQCGTHMFGEAETRPHLIFVRVGTLDDTELGRPGSTIWTSQAPRWACIDQSLPRVEHQPSPVG